MRIGPCRGRGGASALALRPPPPPSTPFSSPMWAATRNVRGARRLERDRAATRESRPAQRRGNGGKGRVDCVCKLVGSRGKLRSESKWNIGLCYGRRSANAWSDNSRVYSTLLNWSASNSCSRESFTPNVSSGAALRGLPPEARVLPQFLRMLLPLRSMGHRRRLPAEAFFGAPALGLDVGYVVAPRRMGRTERTHYNIECESVIGVRKI